MSCRATSEMMSSRLDGTLSSQQVAEMEAHLSCCDSCQRHWELLQLLEYRLEAAYAPIPPSDFTVNVLSRLGRHPIPEMPKRSVLVYLLTVVGLFSSAFAFVVAWSGLSLWPVVSHPTFLRKTIDALTLFYSITSAIIRALWSSFLLIDGQFAGLAATVTGLIAICLLLLWTRGVSQWWQLDGEKGAT